MTSDLPTSGSMVVDSMPSTVAAVCRLILSKLVANSFSQEDVFAVHLALEEAFLNAVRHGNKMDPNKEVRVGYVVDLDKVEVSIADEGDGFDPESVPDPRFGENLLKPDGRGLFLMRAYMNMVKFNERGNCVRMVKYKERPQPAGNQHIKHT